MNSHILNERGITFIQLTTINYNLQPSIQNLLWEANLVYGESLYFQKKENCIITPSENAHTNTNRFIWPNAASVGERLWSTESHLDSAEDVRICLLFYVVNII